MKYYLMLMLICSVASCSQPTTVVDNGIPILSNQECDVINAGKTVRPLMYMGCSN